jgi:hypothetical protein
VELHLSVVTHTSDVFSGVYCNMSSSDPVCLPPLYTTLVPNLSPSAISIAGIICQAYNVLCESEGFNAHFANVYLEAVDFVCISVALYGLIVFYALTRQELVGRRPLAKFLAIKLIVMCTWYQSFIVRPSLRSTKDHDSDLPPV